MRHYPTFFEYLNAQGSLVEKPKIDASADTAIIPKPKAKEDPHKANKTPAKHKQLGEYLNAKGVLVDNPGTEVVPDYNGPTDAKPPGPGSPAPYKAGNSNQAAAKGESGFGDMGEKSLKYEPETKKDKQVPTWPKTTTESFLAKTRGMSMSEFTKFMLEDCGCGGMPEAAEDLPFVTAYSTGKIQPHPPEAIKYVVVLANKNDGVLGNLVHEIKGSGGLGKLLKAILGHPESHDELVGLLGDDAEGPNLANSLARAMSMNYNKFLSDQEGMYESVAPPIGPDTEDDLGMDMDDDTEDDDDFSDNSFEEEPEDRADDEMDDIPGHVKPKKLKKKFAWNHILDAMRKHGLG